ncbi:MAG: DegT/DnrJ/EryC1/StrS family aminotransferase [Streptosporangiaceae bacterium]
MGVQAARVVFPESDRAEIATAITEILAAGALTLGRHTQRFEDTFSAAHAGPPDGGPSGPPHAVAVSSGTAALEILLRIASVGGRDVLIPANTFYATAAAAISAGARPVFADIDPATFALSPQALEAALTPDTVAVVLVHIAGLISPQADILRRICDDRGIVLIEDAAHAHGSTFQGRYAGAFGAAAAFSFYPTKVVTSGEGGMIVTRDPAIADEARIYRDQGKRSFGANHHVRHGYAWRMSELSAAAGTVHLRRMRQFIERRREVAARYDAGLAQHGFLQPLAEPPGSASNFYKYIAFLPPGVDRNWFKERMASRHDIRLAGEVYDLPLHRQPVLASYAPGLRLAAAEDACQRHVCLPVHSDMRDDEVDQVLDAVVKVAADAPAPRGDACASR